MLPLLFAEIGHALVVGNMEEVPVLRLELYGASMQKCQNDLQLWISYLAERTEKLGFLGHKVPEEELVAIFLKGLHPVFQQLQVYFSIPGHAHNVGQGNHHSPQIRRHAGAHGGIGQIESARCVPNHVCRIF